MTALAQARRETLPPLAWVVAALPLFDCIVDQINNRFHPGIGSLSMLQIINGPLTLIFAAGLLWAFLRQRASFRSIPLAVPGALLMLAVACTAELVRTQTLSKDSIGPYGQMVYWVLLWSLVAVLCKRRGTPDLILKGLALGALATSVSVFLGFLFGTTQYYGSDAVTSSAGWFDTAKMITGILVTGGVILLYLGRSKRTLLYPLLAWVCFTGCVMTYARAGWVAAAAVLVWLGAWMTLFGSSSKRRWLTTFFAISLVIAVAVPAAVGVDKLTSRWSDFGQGDEAGSGRATFWKMAFDRYEGAAPSQQVFGRGYTAMADMLFTDYGMDIRHTHNDLLDMLSVAGLCGAAWLVLLIGSMLRLVLRASLFSIEGAAAMAILLTYLLHGQLTGQLWGIGPMMYYTVALTCLAANAQVHAPVALPSTFQHPSLALALRATP